MRQSTPILVKLGAVRIMRRLRLSIPILIVVLLAGCNGFWLDTYWRSERYMLIAIDSLGNMSLSFDTGDGISLGLVPATVYAVGSDDSYIVVKRHPSTDDWGGFDRSKIEYFVVKRSDSSSFAERQKLVRGPFTREQFERLKLSLSLPSFTKTIKELE